MGRREDRDGLSPIGPDEQLLLRHREGDTTALPQLIERHRRGLMTFLRRTVQDPELAEEVFVDTFYAVHKAADRWTPDASFRTFLFRIGRNRAVSALRRAAEKTSRLGTPLHVDGRPRLTLVDGGADPERRAAARERLRQTDAALADLAEPRRTALLLHHVEGLSYPEIAQVMEIPLGTVKTHIFQARRHLKRTLADDREGAAS